MMIKTAVRVFFILLLVFFYHLFPDQEPAEKPDTGTTTEPGFSLEKIQVLSNTALKIPGEYDRGRFIMDGDQLAFEAPQKVKTNLKSNMHLSKYIVCDKQGKIIKEYDRVLMWDYGSLMLKLNALSSLVLVNLENNYQAILNIDVERLSNVNINPFNKTIIYTYDYGSKVYEYDIVNRRSRFLVELMHGNLIVLFQLSPHELIYVSPKFSVDSASRYDNDPSVNIELQMYLANLEREKWGKLTKISSSGILFHFNEEEQDITFVVEEKGYFKFINSKSLGNYKKIKVSQLNQNSKETYEGLLLFHSVLNPPGDLLASSRIKIKKKETSDKVDFDFYVIESDSERYLPEAGEIYMLDLEGNSRKLTDTPDQIEVLNDWSKEGNEMLYYDYKNKSFHLMELDLGGKGPTKTLDTSADKVKKIVP